jgi:predicted transcriptional regulator
MAERAPFIEDDEDAAEARALAAANAESDAARRDRLAWEAEGIAKARAELDAGLYVDADDIDAWIDSMGTDHELPPPPIRHR